MAQQPLERGALPTEPPLGEGHPTHPETDPGAGDPSAETFDQFMQVYAKQLAAVYDRVGRRSGEGR
jgi:hypothetical protein